MCQLNRTIPSEIWPPPEEEAPWDTWPEVRTPYHDEILTAIKHYKDNIPDPSEWSQDYPFHCTQDQVSQNDMDLDNAEKAFEALQIEKYQAKEKKEWRRIELNLTSSESTDYDTD